MHPELVAANFNIEDYLVRKPGQEYQLTPEDACIETEMESGFSRKRRVQSTVFDRVKILWIFQDDEIRLFRLWYAHETNQGQKWFQLQLSTANEVGDCILDDRQCRFMGPPVFIRQADFWHVSADLRVIGDNGTRVNDQGTLEPLPARNEWDDTNTWEE